MSRTSLDSLTSLTPKIRHPTWSHSQHKEHRCFLKSDHFRARSTSVSRSTQTGSSTITCEDDYEDGLVLHAPDNAEDVDVLADQKDEQGEENNEDQDDGLFLKMRSNSNTEESPKLVENYVLWKS